MKLVIKTKDCNFFILLPTALILNQFCARIAMKAVNNKYSGAINLCEQDVFAIINCVKDYKRRHKRWNLIDITTADGEIIYLSI